MSQPSPDPVDVAALFASAVEALAKGERAAAREALERVVDLDPSHVDAWLRLGSIDHGERRHAEAAERFRRVTELQPDDYRGWLNLGTSQRALRQLDESLQSHYRAVAYAPERAIPHLRLGHLLALDLKDQAAAEPHLERALELASEDGRVYSLLSEIRLQQGRVAAALDLFCAGLRRGTAATDLGIRLLDQAGLRPELPADQVAFLHFWRGAELSHDVPRFEHRPSAEAAERRLKVGYVSADFRYHAVSHFIEPVLREHDRAEFQVWAYSNVVQPDEVTDRLRKLVDHWRDVEPLSNAQLAATIREDGIDILVDLSGYTGGSRLRAFACKPAPVQATWIGYPDTTGIPTIDYRIVDAVTDPDGTEPYSSERLLRLEPCFLCYQGHDWAPPPAPSPALRRGYVTFGSFNNSKKISQPLIETWGRLLRELPTARLLLKGRGIDDEAGRARLHAAFTAQGIKPDRLELRGWIDEPMPHLELYGEVDIALDTFPYNGTTMTCEALWMGVPVVALLGDRHARRVSASLLRAAELPELVAADPEQYVAIARGLAADPPRLAERRAGLRERLRASPLCDAPRFTRALEAAYRKVWRAWCRSG